MADEDIKELLEMGFESWQKRFESVSNQPHNDESLWFLKDVSRQEAEELLRDAPTGTFLIRARSAGHYALSIVCKNSTNHCIIYKTDDSYGFAAPYNIYPSLKHLVEHYATNSLEQHNDMLTTTLSIPVLYWHQNKEYITQQLMEEMEMQQQQMELEQQMQEPMMAIQSGMPASAPIAVSGMSSLMYMGDMAASQTPPTATPPQSHSYGSSSGVGGDGDSNAANDGSDGSGVSNTSSYPGYNL